MNYSVGLQRCRVMATLEAPFSLLLILLSESWVGSLLFPVQAAAAATQQQLGARGWNRFRARREPPFPDGSIRNLHDDRLVPGRVHLGLVPRQVFYIQRGGALRSKQQGRRQQLAAMDQRGSIWSIYCVGRCSRRSAQRLGHNMSTRVRSAGRREVCGGRLLLHAVKYTVIVQTGADGSRYAIDVRDISKSCHFRGRHPKCDIVLDAKAAASFLTTYPVMTYCPADRSYATWQS